MADRSQLLLGIACGCLFLAAALAEAPAQQTGGDGRFFNSWYHDPTINPATLPRPEWGTVAITPVPVPVPVSVPATRNRAADTVGAAAPPIPASYVPSIAQPSVPAAAPASGAINITRPQSSWPAAMPAAASATSADPAAPEYVDGIYVLNTDYWLGYPKHVYKLVTAPARFDRNDWLLFGGLVAGAGALFALDENIKDFWQDTIAGGTGSDIIGAFEPLGKTWPVAFGSAGVYAVAEAAEQLGGWNLRREKAAALLTLESVLISQAITTGIKELSGRTRPNGTDDAFLFEGPGNGNSFPSGHATVAFAVATTLSNVYAQQHAWVPWVVYPVATGTALSRIDDNKHWASDVFVGALVGYAVAKTVTLYNPFLSKNKIAVRPLRGGSAQGASVVLGF